jgi:hypothetical protein
MEWKFVAMVNIKGILKGKKKNLFYFLGFWPSLPNYLLIRMRIWHLLDSSAGPNLLRHSTTKTTNDEFVNIWKNDIWHMPPYKLHYCWPWSTFYRTKKWICREKNVKIEINLYLLHIHKKGQILINIPRKQIHNTVVNLVNLINESIYTMFLWG